ncbi:MAG: M48 family metallopeptidase [Desulfobacteraceae bacterium]|nr:M48 family metallopeptidase [Desulfobacteraceae bacterium]
MKFPARSWGWLLILVAAVSCTTVPITGREQLNFIPSQQLMTMSFQNYDQILKKSKLADNPEQIAMVKRVGENIRRGVEAYLDRHGQEDLLKGYKWQFTLVKDDKTANAFALPGGKVVVYTGILPITQDDTGLAVVLGHEIAHAIAQHGGERMSQAMAVQMGGLALAEALGSQGAQTQQLFMAAFGAGSQVGVLLPFSRLQESEADHLGLIFMAMAGYDPRAAVPFWQRMMAQNKGKGQPPELLSTHPADQTRIEQLQRLLPEALEYYHKQ